MNDELLSGLRALTFDDVLVVPGWSEVLPHEVDTSTSIAGSNWLSSCLLRWTR